MRYLAALIVLACCSASLGLAAEIDGDARASDGRTLIVRGTRITLLDIVPFAPDETCGQSARQWACGEVSLRALQAAISGRQITCELVNKVGHGDFQGHCSVRPDTDIARVLVAAGWERASGPVLEGEQTAARLAGKGAWGAQNPR